jgi:hypothetical protein
VKILWKTERKKTLNVVCDMEPMSSVIWNRSYLYLDYFSFSYIIYLLSLPVNISVLLPQVIKQLLQNNFSSPIERKSKKLFSYFLVNPTCFSNTVFFNLFLGVPFNVLPVYAFILRM